MSWLTPDPAERALVADLRHVADDADRALFTLAARLAPALRIDARLLRNARLRFVPDSDAGLEARLWQCHLVARRTRRSITLHAGVARALLDALAEDDDRLAETLAFVADHTCDWHPLDRLEQQLRLDSWRERTERVAANLRPVLRAIVDATGDDGRAEIARWTRQALPAIAGHDSPVEEAGWLSRFAATMLGDPHATQGRPDPRPEPLPPWLADRLPSGGGSRIGLVLHDGAIVCTEPDPAGTPAGTAVLDLPGPLPAAVLLSFPRGTQHEPRWEALWPGHVIAIPSGVAEIVIQTTTGARHGLAASPAERAVDGLSVFISYPHGDEVARRWVDELRERLARNAIPYFSLAEDVRAGERFAERLQSEIGAARALICVVSHATAKSSWIERELEFALAAERAAPHRPGPVPIIPVLVEHGAHLPGPIEDRAGIDLAIDLERDGEQAWDRLLDRLRALGEPVAEAPPLHARIAVVHAPAEAEPAAAIAKALLAHGIEAEPLAEPEDPSRRASVRLAEGPDVTFVRLWSHDSIAPRGGRGVDDVEDPLRPALVIRVDDSPLPEGSVLANVIDLQGFDGDPYSQAGERLVRAVRATVPGATGDDAQPPAADTATTADVPESAGAGPGDAAATATDQPTPDGITREDPSDPAAVPPEVAALLEEIANPSTRPERRLEIGDTLASRGDPRHGVGLRADGLPDIYWIEVPGGRYTYQDGETRAVSPFLISCLPVTNQQFAAFVTAGGYGNDRWWRGLEEESRRVRTPVPGHWPQPNRPRETVSWYEAMAFCAWLSDALGYEVQLPQESQWEAAARGQDALEYPWGNEYLAGHTNVNETEGVAGGAYLAQTTAVGMYPHGASPFGVMDLSGNVWEWCVDNHEEFDPARSIASGEAPPSGSAPRALRGGAWNSSRDDVGAANRIAVPSDYREDNVGFRIVGSSPIPAS